MGRPPCCDKVGIKKGPWTPEEDIVLVTYIQEHGPGNWRSVPTNTGLLRCSKSCRLRWTNYLRPGIKRGNFTPHEEGMIVHLQALWGNKWAAIASYLPQRTDNDIKNYWNTHLKKKMRKLHSSLDSPTPHAPMVISTTLSHEKNTMTSTKTPHNQSANNIYASSTENISRLLEGWMISSSSSSTFSSTSQKKLADDETNKECIMLNGVDLELESVLANIDNIGCSWDKIMSGDYVYEEKAILHESRKQQQQLIQKQEISSFNSNHPPPLTFFDRWLLEDESSQLG